MAERRGGFFGGGNGSDADFDRRPGGSGESREYARRYDPLTEQEFSNLPDIASRIEINQRLEEERARAQQAEYAQAAMSDVHFFPTVGKFIIPEENTWAAHSALIKDDGQNLYFNPEKYPLFDKIIAEKAKNPAITDPTHPDYAKYEGLRTNLAVLRNDLIGIYLQDGSFDPEDMKFVPSLTGIATAIGEGLAHDTDAKRAFARSISLDIANVEGTGAREIYKYLLSIQTQPNKFVSAARLLLHIPDHSYGLPPLETTPYSPRGLSAPPPQPKQCFTPGELSQACAELPDHDRLANASESLAQTTSTLRSPDTLEPPAREASIEEARTILRWLRNLQFGDKDMETWLNAGAPAEQAAKAEAVSRLVEIYAAQLHKASERDPAVMQQYLAEDASNAAGAMALTLAQHSLRSLPEAHPKATALSQWIDSLPASADLRHGQPLTRLLDALELGIEHASGAPITDKSPADRLFELSTRIEQAAYRLRTIDAMKEPAREESIELAREILRRLKKLGSTDIASEESLTTGRPETKAAYAQKIEEMVDLYQNLLQEAAAINPAILQDPRIKDANDAVGGFAHSIKLMAAKEMPNSVAAAQQISADVARMPDEWKNLQDHTVGRLIKSMEGGLEKAVGEIETQQQEQDQDQELAQEAAAEAALLSSHSRRKKRKRRSSSGVSGAKQRKVARDIAADDRAAAQGRFAATANVEIKTPQTAPLGLRPEDLAAVHQLGGSLRDIGNQAKDLGALAPTPDKITPDDKTLAQRQAERNSGGSLKL